MVILIFPFPSVTSSYCSSGSRVPVSVLVDTLVVQPASIIASSTVCSGTTNTLSINGGSLGNASKWYWYSGTCGGTYEGDGDSLIVSPSINITYYVRGAGTCDTTNCVSREVNVNPLSIAPDSAYVSQDTICQYEPVVISFSGGSLGNGANWRWYSGTCGGTPAGNLTTVTVMPVYSTTYYIRAEGTCNTTVCISKGVVVDTLSILPDSISANPAFGCPNNPITLSIKSGVLGTDATWKWYSDSCGVTLEGTGDSIIVQPWVTTTYYLRAEGKCNTTSCISKKQIVGIDSHMPTSISGPSPISAGQPATLTEIGGVLSIEAVWKWYGQYCSFGYIGSGPSVTVYPTVTSTYRVRAEGTCNTTNCKGITVIVKDNAGVTTIGSDSACAGTTVSLPVTGSGFPPMTGISLELNYRGDVLSYISLTNINSTIPASTIMAAQSDFDDSTKKLMIIAGGGTGSFNLGTGGTGTFWNLNFRYYGGTTSIIFNNAVNYGGMCEYTDQAGLDMTDKPTQAYYVNGTVAEVSTSTAATSVTANPAGTCSGDTTTLIISGGVTGKGATWNWYVDSCGGISVGTGTTLSLNPAITTSYYVRAEGYCNTTTCVSTMVSVTQVPIIIGNINGNVITNVGDTEVYSVNDIPGAIYTWSAPSGWIGTGITNTITYIVGNTTGIISVTASNTCGTGNVKILNIGGYTLSGTFNYDDTSLTPMDSVKIMIYDNGVMIDSTRTNISGNYQVPGLKNGVYNITATTHKPWGGVNATDAVKVKRHFAGLNLFTSSIQLHAADVNLSYSINSTDAVKILRRFAGIDTTFDRGTGYLKNHMEGIQ